MSYLITSIPNWIIPVLIIVLSLFSLTVILERIWALGYSIGSISTETREQLLEYIRTKKFEEAKALCGLQKHPTYSIAYVVLCNLNKGISLQKIAEEEISLQLNKLEKYLPFLGTVSTVAPLLGLLGTVTGMIKSFKSFEAAGGPQNAQMMSGIDEALITTALGLVVAIPALVAYNYFIRRVNKVVEDINLFISLIIEQVETTNSLTSQTSPIKKVTSTTKSKSTKTTPNATKKIS